MSRIAPCRYLWRSCRLKTHTAMAAPRPPFAPTRRACRFVDPGATLRIVWLDRVPTASSLRADNAKSGTLLAPLRRAKVRRLSIPQPQRELVGVEDVENPFARDLGTHGDGRGVGVELEVGNGVGVRGEEDLATRVDGEAG